MAIDHDFDTGRRQESGCKSNFHLWPTMTKPICPSCNLPLDACAMTMTGEIDGHHYVSAFCLRCAKRMDALPQSARQRLCLVAENRIARHPERYAVKACADEFEARALQALADDPVTFGQVQGIIIGEG